MKKKLLLLSIFAILLFGNLVSADYITLYQNYVGITLTNGDSYTVDFSNIYPLGDNLYIETTFTSNYGDGSHDSNSYMYINLDADTIVIREVFTYSDDEYATFIDFNGNNVCYSGYSTTNYFKRVVAFMVNSTHMNVTAYSKTGEILCSAVLDVSSSSSLKSVSYSVTTYHTLGIDTLYIKRFSNLLTSLNVYDENSGATISHIDFSEGVDYVRIVDTTGEYAARTYFVTGDLNAYLVKHIEGHYYTIQVGANYANKTLQVLRNINSVWTLVAEAKFDSEGTTSAFLADAVTYKFRIVDGGTTLLETEKTTSPSELTIYLTSDLESLSTSVDLTNKFYWRIEPTDGFLYYNTTNNITVKFYSEELTVSNITLSLTGAGISKTTTYAFNSTSGEFTVNATPTVPNDFVYARLTVVFSDNTSASYLKSFYVKSYYYNTNMTLLGSLEEVPNELGLSKTALTIIVAFISLAAAVAASSFAGDKGGVLGAMLVWLFFAYVKWVDWRIVMISLLAGTGLLIRRGET